jgi:hypothetical protein
MTVQSNISAKRQAVHGWVFFGERRCGWKAFESPGVEPVFPEKDYLTTPMVV